MTSGSVDLGQVDLELLPVRLPELHQQRRLVGDGLSIAVSNAASEPPTTYFSGRLEVGDDLLVEGDVARVAHQELAEVARLGGGEQLGQLGILEALPGGQLGVLVDDERRHVPADLGLRAEQADVDDASGSR